MCPIASWMIDRTGPVNDQQINNVLAVVASSSLAELQNVSLDEIDSICSYTKAQEHLEQWERRQRIQEYS
jgi:hypothetical protein